MKLIIDERKCMINIIDDINNYNLQMNDNV